MTINLKRYNLEFKKTSEYFNWVMESGNSLSQELINHLNTQPGQFFTLLPGNADFEALYDFERGWILPQNPTYEQFDESGKKCGSYTMTPTSYNEISVYIFEKMSKNQNFICIFEDVIKNPSHTKHLEFYNQYGVRYLDEYYYVLDNSIASPKLIVSAISESGSPWHTLFILTENDKFRVIEKVISLEYLKKFCINTQLLVVGAYDGEGYVLWEPATAPSTIS